jgi:putative spermidine/putrescine transport system substrate-binding protein
LLHGKRRSSQILHARPILGRPVGVESHGVEVPALPTLTFIFAIGAIFMKTVRFALFLLALSLVAQSAKAADVICYNCPPEWADWASMLKAIKADLHYDIPHDNKNSGQALAQILAEKSNPVGDIGYFGVTFGMKAKAQDALEPYKPVNWDQVPSGLKDPDGYWTTIHSGTLGLFVNKDALGGKPVPACWKDLLKPDYKGMVGYLDPSSAAVGYVGAVAINLALGGSASNFDPAISFFKDLRKNDPIVPKQTSYARVVSGEMPILLDYDFNAYRAKYQEKGNFEFVIPCEGSVVFPYVVGLVKNAPDKEKAKKVLDYLLSDKGQAIWTNAYLRPARPIELPQAVKAKFLPDSDYARAKSVDWGQMENVQKGFVDRYLAEVR